MGGGGFFGGCLGVCFGTGRFVVVGSLGQVRFDVSTKFATRFKIVTKLNIFSILN